MPDKFILIAILTFLHDFFTAVWIGGMFTLGLTVFPSIKKTLEMGPQTVKLINTIQKKMSKFVYVSIVGLFITGAMQGKMIPEFQGLLHFGNTYSLILGIKHILFLLMIIIAVLRSQIIGRNMKGPNPKVNKIKALLLMLNMLLGIVVLLLSAFNSAIS